ncbi:MFS transporter [Blastopirellula retiformator]|uniref:Putative metabolite transport protein CsbC n=1 Tax=Blastopirellula retiformator TaxID=2527970 RepID=A0A5C5V4F7_9BACT|nr:MFS transporter [Blastopirellula retiformator]TWT32575.1 putative metabolite transport protein CsbC [Blastopirellula retiformator]
MTTSAEVADSGKTVQQYIDEAPIWSDGTATATTPLTPMQWRIWWLAAAGKFFEGLVVFMTGVALPLLAAQFELGPAAHGVVGAASLLGILIGATALGGLADRFGRKPIFILEMAIFTAFLVGVALSPNFWVLVVCLFGLGVALGCDYPTAHLVISECMPSNSRGKFVLGAFGFQAIGALAGAGIGFLILYENPHLDAWRWMYATAIVPAVIVTVARLTITESAHWLFARGKVEAAERETLRLLARTPAYPKEVALDLAKEQAEFAELEQAERGGGYAELFAAKNRRATILTSVPWFLQDLSTYGIGIFTPTILAAAVGSQKEHATKVADIVLNDMTAAKGAAVIDLLLIVGIVAAALLADRVGRIKLQIFGFVGCAGGLFLASLSVDMGDPTRLYLIFAGFMTFSFMTNLGPNAQTYLIAGEVFPTHIRGKGAGLSASFAKIGAVLTAFLFPILLADIGVRWLLYILIAASLLGAIVTWLTRIETAGVNLEEIGK